MLSNITVCVHNSNARVASCRNRLDQEREKNMSNGTVMMMIMFAIITMYVHVRELINIKKCYKMFRVASNDRARENNNS
jgi:hypothetical protein